jgi:HD-like signal output (HDOD) protein
MANFPKNKDAWIRILKQTAIPSFSSNIQTLSELARTILKDPNLTVSVLKLANSAQFNLSRRAIRTISRAVMILGFQAIREVCATCVLIDAFNKNSASYRLKAILARSFHAAVQAKQIASLTGEKAIEEIFISALLLNLGEISVYSSVDEKHEAFEALSEAYPITDGAEREFIGCYFSELTLGLCQAWNIAPMIGQVMGGHYAENSSLRSILLGQSFASNCESKGLEHSIAKYAKSIALYTGKTVELVTERLIAAAEEAQTGLKQLGLKLHIEYDEDHLIEEPEEKSEVAIDKILQLDVILELVQICQESADTSNILPLILEGIVRGGGFKNALVGLLNPERSRITAKYAIESRKSGIKDKFDFNCFHDIPEIHQKVMTNQYTILQTELRTQGMTLKHIFKQTTTRHAMWGPLVIENKVMGCLYADNGPKGSEITPEQQETFQLFVCQAKMFLHKLK